MSQIQMVDLTVQYQTLESRFRQVMCDAMATGAYINGPDVSTFEGEFARFLEVPYAVACANGTDALHIALRALGIGPGDEVITTTFTFIATAGTISLCGATPVFVDIDETSFNLDPGEVEAAITPHTRAIVPVHLYGNPADMDRISSIAKRHGLAVVEDCAQAAGARWKGRKVGSIGTAGCFSFFPSKNLGCFGDGGMIATHDESLARRMRAICAHGSRIKYHNEVLGFNSRLDTVQAAILRVKLPHLEKWNERRREAAHRYNEALKESGIRLPAENNDGIHVYHQYTMRHSKRDTIKMHLQEAGIASMIYYPIPLHRQELYAGLGYAEGRFPRAEAAAREVLSLPMYPELTDGDTRRVAQTVLDALSCVAAPTYSPSRNK